MIVATQSAWRAIFSSLLNHCLATCLADRAIENSWISKMHFLYWLFYERGYPGSMRENRNHKLFVILARDRL